MLFDYNRLRKEQKDKILGKWKPFLKGIEDEYLRESTAMLLENEAQYLMEDPATQSTDVVGIQKILLPIVRRVFPNLVANNLVSVQPLAGPTGVIFWLKYEFASTKSTTIAGSEYSAWGTNPNNVAEGYNPYYSSDSIESYTVSLIDGGGAAHSLVQFNGDPNWLNGIQGSNWTNATNALLSRVIVRFTISITATPTTYSTFLVAFNGRAGQNYWQIKETDRGGPGVPLDSAFTTLVEPTIPYTFPVPNTPGGPYAWIPQSGVLPQLTVTYTDATQLFSVDLFGQNTDFINATYTFAGVQSFYAYLQEGSTEIPDMKIAISQYPVTVKARKLKATWTNEAEQDLKAYHGLNADAELTALVSNEMIAEIDREIVNTCLDIVPISSFRFLDWTSDVSNNTTGNYLDRNRNLVQVLVELSNEIYRKSKIGPGNWIITSPKVSAYLEVLEGFIAAPAATQGGLGIVKAGDYRGTFAVYKDPLFPPNKILMGHKSPSSPFGAGVVYAPYVTQVTPTLYGQDDFTPRKGFLARYGLIQVPLGDFLYAVVSITNLPGATESNAFYGT